MLEPNARELLLDALRPPEDCELVHAIGTTYSLDLQASLFAPLAFAMFDWATDDDGEPNAIALLESLRRYADRTTVFCQAGQIGVPPPGQPLFTYLEPCVVPVTPPDAEKIFHPKLWVLRFYPRDGGRDRYRLLCLTRNLTFDTSWDTACVLEGHRRKGSDTVRTNRPLVAFLRALDTRAPALDDGRRAALRGLADDVADVRFDPPDGFDSVWFRPLGIADEDWRLPSNPRRVLVVSPFLTAGTLDRLHGTDGADILISRQEMFDAVGGDALRGFETYSFADEAAELDDAEADVDGGTVAVPLTDEMRGDAVDADLRDLHAKLIVAEYPADVRFYTGSANATDPAFGGNVEFVVELRTRQNGVGIESLLAKDGGATVLRDLLVPYDADDRGPVEESEEQALSRILDRARRAIGALRFMATLSSHGDDTYVVRLVADGPLDLPSEVNAVTCWPITQGDNAYVTPRRDDGIAAAFGAMSRNGLTSFFAFKVTAQSGSVEDSVRFVVSAELVGAPDGRADDVITQILRDRQDVLRYLLFLLADPSAGPNALFDVLGANDAQVGGDWGLGRGDAPLFETLMRTLARDPSRLDHVAKLLDDLRDTDRGDDLVPEGLDAVWAPIWQARQELDR